MFSILLIYLFQVWAKIWSVLSQHFIYAGSHHDEKIAMYAIDSLRQLGMKYLERAELTNFTFQNDILKPFVILMRNSRNETVRRLIVDCIVQVLLTCIILLLIFMQFTMPKEILPVSKKLTPNMGFQMIKSKVRSIKSGWRSVFMVFTAAADDELEFIVESAFENVEQGRQFAFSSRIYFICTEGFPHNFLHFNNFQS